MSRTIHFFILKMQLNVPAFALHRFCGVRDSHHVLWFMLTANQWIQLDIGPPTTVTAVVTKGRGDTRRKQWVTKYTVSYSNDSTNWSYYKDSLQLEKKVRVTLSSWHGPVFGPQDHKHWGIVMYLVIFSNANNISVGYVSKELWEWWDLVLTSSVHLISWRATWHEKTNTGTSNSAGTKYAKN